MVFLYTLADTIEAKHAAYCDDATSQALV